MVKVAAILATLSTLLLSGPSVDISQVYIEPSGNYGQDVITLGALHQEQVSLFNQLNEAILGETAGLVKTADNLDQITINQANIDSYRLEAEKWQDQALQLLDLANDSLVATVNFNTFFEDMQNSARLAQRNANVRLIPGSKGDPVSIPGNIPTYPIVEPQQQFVTIATLAVLGGVAGYLFYQGGKQLLEKDQMIVSEVAAKSPEDKARVIQYMRDRGIQVADDATVLEIDSALKSATIGQQMSLTKAVRGDAISRLAEPAGESYQPILDKDKERRKQITVDAGNLALSSEIQFSSLAFPSIGSLFSNSYLGAGIDLATGLTSTDPLGLLGRSLTITASSKATNAIPVIDAEITENQALLTFADLKLNGPENIHLQDIDKAVNAYGSILAQNDGDGDAAILTYPKYTFFQNIPLSKGDPAIEEWLGNLQIPEDLQNYLFDFMITNLEGLLKMLENIRPTDVTDIALQEWAGGLVCLTGEKVVNGACEPKSCIGDSYNCPSCTGTYVFYDYNGNGHCFNNLAAEFAFPADCPATGSGSDLFTKPDGEEVTCLYVAGELSHEMHVGLDNTYKFVWYYPDWGGTGNTRIEYWIEDWNWQPPQWLQDTAPLFTFTPRLALWFWNNSGNLISTRPTVDQGSTQHGTYVTFHNDPAAGICTDQASYIDYQTNGVQDGLEMSFDQNGVMTSCTNWINGLDTGSCL